MSNQLLEKNGGQDMPTCDLASVVSQPLSGKSSSHFRTSPDYQSVGKRQEFWAASVPW